MCGLSKGTGACLLYGISRVVIGENKNFVGGEAYLRSRGVEVVVLDDKDCTALMDKFIEEKPELWYVLNILASFFLPPFLFLFLSSFMARPAIHSPPLTHAPLGMRILALKKGSGQKRPRQRKPAEQITSLDRLRRANNAIKHIFFFG